MRVRKNGSNGVKAIFEDGAILDFGLGNRKISRYVLLFSLPAGIRGTCPFTCKNCYALKTERLYKTAAQSRRRNYHTICDDPNKLWQAIQSLISRYPDIRTIRIHEGGEFFSVWYVWLWDAIAKLVRSEGIDIYTYTKTHFAPYFHHVNVVRSILPDGSFNFGDPNYIYRKQAKFNYPVCPATAAAGHNITCGEDCTLCHHRKHVLFYKH